jgi:16S rRNA (cytosine1402-N4)-methyltransferase
LRYFDGTAGRGGHLQAVLSHFPGISCLAWDQDPEAVEAVRALGLANTQVQHKNFHELSSAEMLPQDLMLLDLGVSSPQLDQGARGFSFYADGPLDMRMNNSQGITAAKIINEALEDELIRIFRDLGEVQRPLKVVRNILTERLVKPFTTTGELAKLIERTDGWRRRGQHPATNYFMALRIHVNNELDGLKLILPSLRDVLKPGGRLAVLTFHSLEDRIVKYDFKEATNGHPVNKKVIVPDRAEQVKNPRSRSAKLRVFEKSGL